MREHLELDQVTIIVIFEILMEIKFVHFLKYLINTFKF